MGAGWCYLVDKAKCFDAPRTFVDCILERMQTYPGDEACLTAQEGFYLCRVLIEAE